MTTGHRLARQRDYTLAKLIFSAAIWCAIGSGIGWTIGNHGGFKRGVETTASLIEGLLNAKEIPQSHKFTDL